MTLQDTTTHPCSVRGVLLYEVKHVRDMVRGNLAVLEFDEVLPFRPRRCFITYKIPAGQTRGDHAHRQCAQFMVCVTGSCRLRVDDGRHWEEILLNRPTLGIYVPPQVWVSTQHGADSALMVFASHPYDPADYIRDRPEFQSLIGGPGTSRPRA